jgi:hypothetical protein
VRLRLLGARKTLAILALLERFFSKTELSNRHSLDHSLGYTVNLDVTHLEVKREPHKAIGKTIAVRELATVVALLKEWTAVQRKVMKDGVDSLFTQMPNDGTALSEIARH